MRMGMGHRPSHKIHILVEINYVLCLSSWCGVTSFCDGRVSICIPLSVYI
jgi:hypothetical protein